MSFLTGLRCFRCEHTYEPDLVLFECPACASDVPSSLYCVYDYAGIAGSWSPEIARERDATMWRYAEFFPVEAANAVTLGEGMTPLLRLDHAGARLGCDSLYLKDESQNPTWSFKDRLASVGATKALELGREVLTAASSGNGGAATAAYAARAGLRSIIVTAGTAPAGMRALMSVYGTLLLATERNEERGPLVRHGVEEHGWFPIQNYLDPLVGANTFAREGCKAIAFEICEQLGWRTPDAVVFPITLADNLVGAWRGFAELQLLGVTDRMPRLYGAEVYGPLEHALVTGELTPVAATPSRAVSTASTKTTYQALAAVRASNGWSVTAGSDVELQAAQSLLAEEEGIFAELSGALALAGADRLLRDGKIRRDETVVVVSTSGGLKDFDIALPEPDVLVPIEPTPAGMAAALEQLYGYSLDAHVDAAL
jgi:threonine synthase